MDTKSAILNAFYEATGRGDWTAAETYLSDDLVITEADALPYAGVYRGKGALRTLYARVMAMMDVEGLELVQNTSGGDYAVALVDMVFKRPSGLRAQLAEVYRFEGDLICETWRRSWPPWRPGPAAGHPPNRRSGASLVAVRAAMNFAPVAPSMAR